MSMRWPRHIPLLLLTMLAVACGNSPQPDNGGVQDGEDPLAVELRALDSISTLIDRSPGNADLLNARAQMMLDRGEVDYALADAGRAILIDSTKAAYYLTIADIYFQRDEPKRSLRALEKARRMDPKNLDALHRMAQFKLYLEHHQESIDLANEMLAIDPQDDRPFLIKALAFRDSRDTVRAIENYLMAAEQNPDNFDVQMALGVLHYGKKSRLAESFLRNALDIVPGHTGALYALGMCYQRDERAEEAIATYRQLLEVDSTHHNALYNIGHIHFTLLEDYPTALDYFQKTVRFAPDYHDAIYMRGACYEAMGNSELARREYSYLLQLAPNHAKAAGRMNTLLGKK